MKFTITLKDPDCLYEPVEEAVRAEVEQLGLSEDEVDAIVESRSEKVRKLLARWFEYDEYLRLEADTEAETLVVQERKR